MALGRFMKMIEGMLGAGQFQIAGDAEVYDTKVEIDAALFERGLKMEAVWYPASEQTDAPEWAGKVYHLRTIADHRRADGLVFAE
jgi:hypothetical protein